VTSRTPSRLASGIVASEPQLRFPSVAEDAEIVYARTLAADGPPRGDDQRDEERASAYDAAADELKPIDHRSSRLVIAR
jgi:hypothetical protein